MATIDVVILGAYGMLGHALQQVFPEAGCFGRELDITIEDQITKFIKSSKPEVIINAAAISDVDKCEEDPDEAYWVNSEGPLYLAEACEKTGTRLVHYSTDNVFDGKRSEYCESDTPNPINVYGRSKMLGEKHIQESMYKYLIIRTSWLYGMHGVHGMSFAESMVVKSEQMTEVKVPNDIFGNPTYTMDLAKMTRDIIDRESGIYHLTNEGVCSLYEFASTIVRDAVPCSSDEFVQKVKCPKHSILANTKTDPLRHWTRALPDYLSKRRQLR